MTRRQSAPLGCVLISRRSLTTPRDMRRGRSLSLHLIAGSTGLQCLLRPCSRMPMTIVLWLLTLSWLLTSAAIGPKCRAGRSSDLVAPLDHVNDDPSEPWGFFDDMPLEIVETIAVHLAIDDYLALVSTCSHLASMRSARMERELLMKAAKQVATYRWYINQEWTHKQRILRSVARLYCVRAGLARTLSADDPPEEIEAARDRFLLYYDECVALATLTRGNQESWKRQCAETFFWGTLWRDIWHLFPEAFRQEHRWDALRAASREGDFAITIHLLETRVYERVQIELALYSLAKYHHLDLFLLLLQRRFALQNHDCRVEEIVKWAFQAVCRYGRMSLLEELLKLNDAGDALFYGPFDSCGLALGLTFAMEKGHMDVVRHLLFLRANPLYERVDAFKQLVVHGFRHTVMRLLERRDGVPVFPELVVSEEEVSIAADLLNPTMLMVLLESFPAHRLQQYIVDARFNQGGVGCHITRRISLHELRRYHARARNAERLWLLKNCLTSLGGQTKSMVLASSSAMSRTRLFVLCAFLVVAVHWSSHLYGR